MTCFAAVDLGGQSGRVVLGRAHRRRLRYREVHRFANVPRVMRTGDGTRWHRDTEALWEETLEGLVARADAMVPPAEAWARTGIEKAPMNTSGRLAADARTGLLFPGVTALLTPDLFTFWLTGARGAERTIASTTELLDARTGDWALDLAKRWGIDPAVLPPVVPAGSHAGPTLARVTARIGADAPVSVYRVASHDTASAVAAATSSAEASADGRTLLLRNLSGLWLLESCLTVWVSGHDRSRRRAELLAAAAALPDGGPVVDAGDPALRAPGDMPARLAALTGCDLSPAQTVRCILDSLAGAFATALTVAADLTGVVMGRVHLLGGGSRVTALARSTARATGLPVVAGPAEATSTGNLMVQAVAAGAFDSLDSARAAVDHGSDGPILLEPAC